LNPCEAKASPAIIEPIGTLKAGAVVHLATSAVSTYARAR
jgi:hypothetical protein